LLLTRQIALNLIWPVCRALQLHYIHKLGIFFSIASEEKKKQTLAISRLPRGTNLEKKKSETHSHKDLH